MRKEMNSSPYDDELIGILKAISIVSKRLAEKLARIKKGI